MKSILKRGTAAEVNEPQAEHIPGAPGFTRCKRRITKGMRVWYGGRNIRLELVTCKHSRRELGKVNG